VGLSVTNALGKKIPQSPARFASYLLGLVGIVTQICGDNHEKLKIPSRQLQVLEDKGFLSRLDTAISSHFSHLCRQIKKGNVSAILTRHEDLPKITPKPLQDRRLETSKNSMMSLKTLGSQPNDSYNNSIQAESGINLECVVTEEIPETLAVSTFEDDSLKSTDSVETSEHQTENSVSVDVFENQADNFIVSHALEITEQVPLFDFSPENEDPTLPSWGQSSTSS
jgi:hypothetical protein